MDPDNQALIKRIVDEIGDTDIVVMLGAADAEAVEVAAETVRDGDPAWVGPLAGVQLGLPVLHVFEDDVKEQADDGVYEAQIGFFEMTLDVDGVKDAMKRDWEQTKADLHLGGKELDQDVDDTLKQVAGKDAIPPGWVRWPGSSWDSLCCTSSRTT